MNYSKQRKALLEILRSTNSHPTANEIYMKMRESDSKISLGTIYRNLSLLADNGIIQKIDAGHDCIHYDGCTSPHYHFVCNECGSVSDLDIRLTIPDKEVEKLLECNVSSYSLIFYGVCKNCR